MGGKRNAQRVLERKSEEEITLNTYATMVV